MISEKNKTAYMSNTNKNPKQNLFESDSENKITEFPGLIVTELLEEIPLVKFSPFLIV